MRPLVLEMQGFGPYSRKVTIDFTNFAEGGIYLVTGETGSGKTFIFDGICYALFGEVSGGERKTEMLRTMGLDDGVETYVKLSFRCGDKEYSVYRKPAYERAKKKGEGKVTDNARVEFTDGFNTYTKIEEVNRLIREILGLNVEQFKQIVMIAQGKFAQILQKSTKERQGLLREIFNTNKYVHLELGVKEENGKLSTAYAACKRDINEKLHEITASDEKFDRELRELQEAEFLDVDKMENLLQEFDKVDNALTAKFNGEIQRLHAKEVQLKLDLAKAGEREAKEQNLARLQRSKQDLDAAAAKAQQEAEKAGEAIAFFMELREEWQRVESCLKDLNNINEGYRRYFKAKQEAEGMDAQIKRAADTVLAKRKHYDQMYGRFIKSQAGIIAKTLKEGDPCPVCGSVFHPAPAVLGEDSCTEEDVEWAEKDWKDADAKYHHILGNKEKAEQVKRDTLQKYLELATEYYGTDLGDDVELINQKVVGDSQKQSIVKKETERKGRDKKAELGMKAEENVEQFQVRVQETAVRIREQTARIAGQIKTLQDELAKLDNQLKPDNISEEIKENDLAINGVKEQLERVQARQTINKQAIRSIMQKQEEMKKISAQLAEMDNLYKTLSGNLNTASAAKISFETYMQQEYFDRILAYANTRLLKISRSRYKLVRKDEGDSKGNAKVGLDMNVHDSYSGKERSANSLSGGETFMASLALALGMADEVQTSAGGIHIDTMFIDEGFGSLSKDFLGTTVDVLNTLADNSHLVGVISHVDELKERIEQQIVVSKNPEGYSTIAVEV